MRVSFLRRLILIDGAKLRAFMNAAEMEAIAGTEISRESKPIEPNGFEHRIETDRGIRWCVREPESIVTSMQLAISTKLIREFAEPSHVCYFPRYDFPGVVDLNGWTLNDDCTENSLRQSHEWILNAHMGGCYYETAEHSVGFFFEPNRKVKGIVAKLTCISIHFLKAEPFYMHERA